MTDLRDDGVLGQPASDWIDWAGGECPVSGDTLVEIECRSGQRDNSETAGLWAKQPYDLWKHEPTIFGHDCDIIAYRIVSPTPAGAER